MSRASARHGWCLLPWLNEKGTKSLFFEGCFVLGDRAGVVILTFFPIRFILVGVLV